MRKKSKRLSIVIPVYNIENYIEDCILSVQNQGFRDIEVLLVDDGSTDRSLVICEAYAKLDDRIKVFSKKNGGPSSARNLGLENASGDYVIFLDGDDTLLDDSLARINDILTLEEPDLMTCDYNTSIRKQQIAEIDIKMINSLNDYLSLMNDIPWATWRSVYRKDIIRDYGLRFNEKLICAEDCDFFMKFFKKCKRRLYVNIPLIEYRINRDGSITNSIKCSTICSELRTFSDYYRRFRNRNDYVISGLFAKKYVNTITTLYYLDDKDEIKQLVGIIKKNKDIIKDAKGNKYLVARLVFKLFGYYRGSKLLKLIKGSV